VSCGWRASAKLVAYIADAIRERNSADYLYADRNNELYMSRLHFTGWSCEAHCQLVQRCPPIWRIRWARKVMGCDHEERRSRATDRIAHVECPIFVHLYIPVVTKSLSIILKCLTLAASAK